MARGTAAGLEEDLLQGARRRFSRELGRVDNNFGKGFEDRSARRDDRGAGFGQVPIAPVLKAEDDG